MRAAFTTLMSLLVLSGCAVPRPMAIPDPGNLSFEQPEYISLKNPRSSPWFEKETATGKKKIFWESLSNAQTNRDLPLERSYASIFRKSDELGLGFASAKFTAEAGEYTVYLDYTKYRDEVIQGENTPCRVGVGVRIVANVTTKKANVDLGNIFALAVAAKSGYLNGQIEVLKIGIDSPRFGLVLPPPQDISDAALNSAIQAVAAVRAKLYDSDTALTPHVLALAYKTKDPSSNK